MLAVLEAVDARSEERARIVSEAGLDAARLSDPDQLLDLEAVLRVSRAAAEAVGDDFLGLHLGERWPLGELGVLHYAVLNAPTVGTALENLDRYGRSHIQGGGIRFARVGREASLGYELEVRDRELARQHVEASAVAGLRILRRFLGDAWAPRSVGFGHRRPRSTSEHERIFGCPLAFEQPTNVEILFDAEVLDRPVPGADRKLLPLVERHLEQLIADRGEDAWLGEVRSTIAHALCDGSTTIRRIAKQLGTSVRTLQRRLDERQIAFRTLVAEIRRDLAYRYLADEDASLTEVAFLLGYSELSAFDRAFRRWTGATPLEERKRLRGERSA